MLRRPSNRSREDILRLAKQAVETHGGADVARVWYKYDCRGCGERCVVPEPNFLPPYATCELCGTVSQILGAGYRLEVRASRFVPWESPALVVRPVYQSDQGDA